DGAPGDFAQDELVADAVLVAADDDERPVALASHDPAPPMTNGMSAPSPAGTAPRRSGCVPTYGGMADTGSDPHFRSNSSSRAPPAAPTRRQRPDGRQRRRVVAVVEDDKAVPDLVEVHAAGVATGAAELGQRRGGLLARHAQCPGGAQGGQSVGRLKAGQPAQ